MNYKTKTVRHQQQYQKWKGLYTKPSSHSTPILYSNCNGELLSSIMSELIE